MRRCFVIVFYELFSGDYSVLLTGDFNMKLASKQQRSQSALSGTDSREENT